MTSIVDGDILKVVFWIIQLTMLTGLSIIGFSAKNFITKITDKLEHHDKLLYELDKQNSIKENIISTNKVRSKENLDHQISYMRIQFENFEESMENKLKEIVSEIKQIKNSS